MGLYFDEVKRSMKMLAKDRRTLFVGQWYGRIHFTLEGISETKKYELPVIEDTQMGICTGLALTGIIPISCYVRWNFLLLAANQLVNHLDKIEEMSNGGFKPKVIIRTSVGSTRPLHPGCQSTGDYTAAFRLMLTNIDVVSLYEPEDVFPAYSKALRSERSTLVVEHGNCFEDK